MISFIFRRLAVLPFALLVANFFGYAYAHLTQPLHAAQNPFVLSVPDSVPLLPTYAAYIRGAVRFNWGMMPYAGETTTIAGAVGGACLASLGLLVPSLVISALLGLFLGARAVHPEPPRTAAWLTSLSTLGLAMPSFYIGSLAIVATLAYIVWGPGGRPPLPIGGYGWDGHLALPILVLMLRPTMQVAQVTAGLLVGELNKQYVVAARSVGHSWRAIRRRFALRNVLAPVVVTIAGSLRWLMGELIVVEWLFEWPGLGRMVAQTLVPARSTASAESLQFLNPPILAALLTLLAALFLVADLVATVFARRFDPRLRQT